MDGAAIISILWMLKNFFNYISALIGGWYFVEVDKNHSEDAKLAYLTISNY